MAELRPPPVPLVVHALEPLAAALETPAAVATPRAATPAPAALSSVPGATPDRAAAAPPPPAAPTPTPPPAAGCAEVGACVGVCRYMHGLRRRLQSMITIALRSGQDRMLVFGPRPHTISIEWKR